MRICIDAGHGGKDNGAMNGTRFEKDDTLELAFRLGKALKKVGIDVVYVREKDVYIPKKARADIANRLKADLFLSIHRGKSLNKNITGVTSYVYSKRGMVCMLAKAFNTNLCKLGFKNRGVHIRKFSSVLRDTMMPALQIEYGYITNGIDNVLFDAYVEELVEATVKAIVKVYHTSNVTL